MQESKNKRVSVIRKISLVALSLFILGTSSGYSSSKTNMQRQINRTEQQEPVKVEEETLLPSQEMLEHLLKYHQIDKETDKRIRRLVAASRHKSDLERMITESTKYEDYFKEASKATGLDKNLIKAYLMVESGYTNFSPNATSVRGAVGPAQMMEEAASLNGLKIIRSENGTILYDERRDPKSIIASAKFLKDLIDLHKGDVVLGLAGYNYGPTKLQSLIGQKKTRVFKKLFRNVIETRLYVPKVLSRMYILRYIDEYDLRVSEKPVYSDVRKASKKHVAEKNETIDGLIKKYHTDRAVIKHLNPALTSNKIPKGVEVYVEDLNPRYKRLDRY